MSEQVTAPAAPVKGADLDALRAILQAKRDQEREEAGLFEDMFGTRPLRTRGRQLYIIEPSIAQLRCLQAEWQEIVRGAGAALQDQVRAQSALAALQLDPQADGQEIEAAEAAVSAAEQRQRDADRRVIELMAPFVARWDYKAGRMISLTADEADEALGKGAADRLVREVMGIDEQGK